MDERVQKVLKWLEGLSPDKKAPHFEIDEYTVGVLEVLMKRNQESEQIAVMKIEDAKKKAQEYEAESKRIGCILKDLGIAPNTLETNILAPLTALCRTSEMLDVDDATSARASMQMYDMLKENLQLEVDLRKIQELNTALSGKISNTVKFGKELKRVVKELKDENDCLTQKIRRDETQSFYHAKMKTYEEQIRQFEEALSKSGFHPSVEQKELAEQHKKLEQLTEELGTITKKLDDYYNLPPDVKVISQKIVEAKTELRFLEEKFCKYGIAPHD